MEAALAAAEPQPPWLSTTCALQYMCSRSQVTFHEVLPWFPYTLNPIWLLCALWQRHLGECWESGMQVPWTSERPAAPATLLSGVELCLRHFRCNPGTDDCMHRWAPQPAA